MFRIEIWGDSRIENDSSAWMFMITQLEVFGSLVDENSFVKYWIEIEYTQIAIGHIDRFAWTNMGVAISIFDSK